MVQHDARVKTRVGVLLLLAGGALGAVFVLGAVQHVGPAAQLFSTECSVGMAGTSLSITAEGPDAEPWCASVEGVTSASGATWYRYGDDEQLPGVLVCRDTYSGNVVTVRDSGALMLYGSEACASIQSTGGLALGGSLAGTQTDSGSGTDHSAIDSDTDRRDALAREGVCLLTVPDHNVAIYTVGAEARTYCEDLIDDRLAGLNTWRVAQGFSGSGHKPPLICESDYGDLMVEVFDSGAAYFGGLVCDALP